MYSSQAASWLRMWISLVPLPPRSTPAPSATSRPCPRPSNTQSERWAVNPSCVRSYTSRSSVSTGEAVPLTTFENAIVSWNIRSGAPLSLNEYA